jgi:isoleucyl-tRNA synthetase
MSNGPHPTSEAAEQLLQELLLPTSGRFNLARMEEQVLRYWTSIDAFKTSLKLSEGRPLFTFYDGPPFATGRPHYGHILAGTIKDTVTRYAHQTGHYVSRRFGWDCHGLPVEHEIDKKLGIKSKDDVMEMGIAAYNEECRGIVSRYTGEWEKVVNRLGRWIDFENDYKTMEPWFMESVWWVFKTIYEKHKLVYRSYKVMPYSTSCTTPLSNFEAGLDYRDVTDPAVTVMFPLEEDPETNLLAWTTTPWTLPSNLALCVNSKMDYVKIKDAATGRIYVLAEERLCELYKGGTKAKGNKKKGYEPLSKFKGIELVGKKYTPIFPYYKDRASTSFRVLEDSYVTSESGTGIVHQAPAFGEDDYRVCAAHGIIDKKEEVPCPIDANGRFVEPVSDFLGKHVKEADSEICQMLKQMGRLVKKANYKHSYPFCWRSGTPLIYKAVPSWFVEVTAIKKKLVENNEETYWVPGFVGGGRFKNWLEGARDWAISRSRYWGTPLPIWASEDMEEIVVVGSIAELEELTGEKVTDIHRHFIDHLEIPSKQGKGMLKRVDEVFDCWFESGSMPYAQLHYPFENKHVFENGFPADFIAEGLDQTRGWFYTLMVLSTALFGKPAFKNVIVNGLVKAADGKKMSKSLKNYPDPQIVINKHSADALRLYLINSPLVRAQELSFSEAGVGGIVRDVLLKWYNTMQFFAQSKQRFELAMGKSFFPSSATAASSTNVMDTWIISTIQTLTKNVRKEMQAYLLYNVVDHLLSFIEQITNWYVKLNRSRMKGRGNTPEDWETSLCCLYESLFQFARLMAPLAPFFAEYAYQRLRPLHPDFKNESVAVDAPGRSDSVHYILLPEADMSLIDKVIERRVSRMQEIVELGRKSRDLHKLPLKFPCRTLVLVCSEPCFQEDISAMSKFIREELNVAEITFDDNMNAWCSLSATPNNKILGRALGKQFKQVLKEVKALDHDAVSGAKASGSILLPCGVEVKAEHLVVDLNVKCNTEKYGAQVGMAGKMFVALDRTQDRASLASRLSRDLTSRVQKMRKNAGLLLTDVVEVFVGAENGESTKKFLQEALKTHDAEIRMKLHGGTLNMIDHLSPHATIIKDDTFDITNPEVEGVPTKLTLRIAVAVLCAIPNKASLIKACGDAYPILPNHAAGDAYTILANHAAHTLATLSYHELEAQKSVELKLKLNSKAAVVTLLLVRGQHYYMNQIERENN